MNARSIGYWVTTGLFIVAMAGSAIGDLVQAPAIADGFALLGYPLYLMTLLGIWKVLGILAIAVPGLPRLKEFAYAGFTFHLTGAGYSHLAAGEGSIAPVVVLLALGAASWALRPESRVLGTLLPARLSSPAPAPTAAVRA